MKLILLLLAAGFIIHAPSNTFDPSSYVIEEYIIQMLDQQHVKDIKSDYLSAQLTSFFGDHIDEIDHISGHYSTEYGIFYYAVFATKGNSKIAEYLQVDPLSFKDEAYDFIKLFNSISTSRAGNGFPHPRICPVGCDNYNNGCLGLICPPSECIW